MSKTVPEFSDKSPFFFEKDQEVFSTWIKFPLPNDCSPELRAMAAIDLIMHNLCRANNPTSEEEARSVRRIAHYVADKYGATQFQPK